MTFVFTLLATFAMSAEQSLTEGKHLFILSGQSNMRNPLPTAFEAAVGKAFGADKVIVVTMAHPSQPIRRWYQKWELPAGMEEEPLRKGQKPVPNGNIYDRLITSVKNKIAGRSIASVTYIWMQGEADASKGWGEVYEESFYGVIDQIKADLEIGQVNYVIGRINDYWTTARGVEHGDLIREIQKKIGEAHDHGDWVNTDDLNTGINPWGIYMFCDGHFPPSAYSVLGERFARKACLLIDPSLTFNDDLFVAKHFDRTEEITGHSATGCQVSGSKPDRGALDLLTDGKFAKPHPGDGAWLAFSTGGDEMTGLILDLGESVTTDQVGLSLLYHPEAGAPFPKKMTMEASLDAKNWQSLNRRDFRFTYGRALGKESRVDPEPQSMLALAPGPRNRGVPLKMRYLRIRIEAPRVFIDEIIVDPVAGK